MSGLEVAMSDTIIGAVSVLTGGALGFLAATYTDRADRKLEFEKWVRARDDDVNRDVRMAVASVVMLLAEYAHSLMWSTFSMISAQHEAIAEEDAGELAKTLKTEVHSL